MRLVNMTFSAVMWGPRQQAGSGRNLREFGRMSSPSSTLKGCDSRSAEVREPDLALSGLSGTFQKQRAPSPLGSAMHQGCAGRFWTWGHKAMS